jgi:diamine N-acetyltransferase
MRDRGRAMPSSERESPEVTKKPAVKLLPITAENWLDCIKLKVRPGQEKFVASNIYSLAQARIYPECIPLGIQVRDRMVGFAMYAVDRDDGNLWIYRFMIDASMQGKGIGYQALLEVIDFLRILPGFTVILLSVHPENVAAERLYRKAGFRATGQMLNEETVMCLDLRNWQRPPADQPQAPSPDRPRRRRTG